MVMTEGRVARGEPEAHVSLCMGWHQPLDAEFHFMCQYTCTNFGWCNLANISPMAEKWVVTSRGFLVTDAGDGCCLLPRL